MVLLRIQVTCIASGSQSFEGSCLDYQRYCLIWFCGLSYETIKNLEGSRHGKIEVFMWHLHGWQKNMLGCLTGIPQIQV